MLKSNYDEGKELIECDYQGFLSKDMTYSCAIFPDLDGDLSLSPPPAPPVHALTAPRLAQLQNLSNTSNPAYLSLSACAIALDSTVSSDTSSTIGGGNVDLLDTFHSAMGKKVGDQDDSLYLAQLRKLQYLIEKANIQPGHRVC